MFSLFSRILLVIAGFSLAGSYFFNRSDHIIAQRYCGETITIECLFEASIQLSDGLDQFDKNSVVRDLVLANFEQAPKRILTLTERQQSRWLPYGSTDYSAVCHIVPMETPITLKPPEQIEEGHRGLVFSPWEDYIKLAEKAIDDGEIDTALVLIDTAISLVPTKAKRMHFSLLTGPFESGGDQRDDPRSQIAAAYLRMGDRENFSKWMAQISTHGSIRAWHYVINKGLPLDIIEQEVLGSPLRVQAKALSTLAMERYKRGNGIVAEEHLRRLFENDLAIDYSNRRIAAITAINFGDRILATSGLRQLVYTALGNENARDISDAARIWHMCAPDLVL